jgi:hypothetical protein
VPRAIVLLALVLGLLTLAACAPSIQSLTQAPTPTPAAQPSVAPTATSAPAKPTTQAAAPKPASSPAPATQATATPAGAARAATSSPPALVATSVAGLPGASPSPAVVAESRGAAPPDAAGIASSAGSVAAANVADGEAVALCGPGAILSTRAAQVVGRSATIAIARASASYQRNVRGQPTFINDAPFPNHVFTAVVWGRDRGQFQPPPESYDGKA